MSDRLRYRRDDRRVFLYAFDLIELARAATRIGDGWQTA
jgi:hypothetical protein